LRAHTNNSGRAKVEHDEGRSSGSLPVENVQVLAALQDILATEGREENGNLAHMSYSTTIVYIQF